MVSVDPEISPEVISMIGTSAALSISGIPFNGPLGSARVGYVDGEYILNPTVSQLENSQLELSVAGTESAVLMVESEASALPEEVMLGAVVYGHDQQQVVINAIKELKAEVNKPDWEWTAPVQDQDLVAKIKDLAEAGLTEAYQIEVKQDRYAQVGVVKAAAKEALLAENPEADSREIDGL